MSRHGHFTSFRRMHELTVASLRRFEHPAVPFQQFEDVPNLHYFTLIVVMIGCVSGPGVIPSDDVVPPMLLATPL